MKPIPYSFLLLSVLMFMVSCRSAKVSTVKHSDPKPTAFQKEKYEKAMGIDLPNTINPDFIKFVSDWIGAPYKYGGNTPLGTDCSGFVNATYQTVFKKSIARSSAQLYADARRIKENEAQEGDLIFFTIQGEKVSHVGMHITGNYFIHASTKKGVVINSNEEPYYKQHFKGYGRIL